MFSFGFGLLFFPLQLFLFLQVGVSHLLGGVFTLEQWCRCYRTHVGSRKARHLPWPSLALPHLPRLLLQEAAFVLLDESISSKPRTNPPFWRMTVQSNFNFSIALSGVPSKLLKKKGKWSLLAEGCRCSGISLHLKNSISPALYHIHEFLLYCTANGYIKRLEGLHHGIADSPVAEYDDTIDCLSGSVVGRNKHSGGVGYLELNHRSLED